ncbi:hypothetical protein DID95_04390 [Vibrio fluvialis]|nr:hypothetical protein [Vibrio fluvialis]
MNTSLIIDKNIIFTPINNTLRFIDSENDKIILGENECRLLYFLATHKNETVSREQIIAFVWSDRNFIVDSSSLTQAISTLRKALNDSTKNPIYIKTVPKKGYEFICDVETLDDEPNIENDIVSDNTIKSENDDNTHNTNDFSNIVHQVDQFIIGETHPPAALMNHIVRKFSVFIIFAVFIFTLEEKIIDFVSIFKD